VILITLWQNLNDNTQHHYNLSLIHFAVAERIVRALLADADGAQKGDADIYSLSFYPKLHKVLCINRSSVSTLS